MLVWYFLANEQKLYFLDACVDNKHTVQHSISDGLDQRVLKTDIESPYGAIDDLASVYFMRLDDKIKQVDADLVPDDESPCKKIKAEQCVL